MLPTHNDVHEDKILTNICTAYRSTDWIWDMVFPVVDTGGRLSDKYYTFTKGDWLRNDAEVLAPGDPAPISGFRVSTDSFSCNEYGIAAQMPKQTLENADAPLQQSLLNQQGIWCTDTINRKMEVDLATTIFTTSVWGTDNTSATDWDDFDSSTPIDDVIGGADTIQGNTGKDPNTLIIGQQVWSKLKRNPEILSVLGANERGAVTADMLANFLEVDRLLVGRAVYNTANEAQTASLSRAWGKNALLLYVTPQPGIMTPTAGYTFRAHPLRIYTWYEDNATHKELYFVRATISQGYKVVGSDLGYFFSSVVS